jgi:hypothetical protein
MKAYEAAKLKKMTNKEFLKEYELKSHMSKISPELEAELFGEEKKIQAEPESAPTVDTAEADVVTPVEPTSDEQSTECPYTKEQIELGIRCLGNKSPVWEWRHIIERGGAFPLPVRPLRL